MTASVEIVLYLGEERYRPECDDHPTPWHGYPYKSATSARDDAQAHDRKQHGSGTTDMYLRDPANVSNRSQRGNIRHASAGGNAACNERWKLGGDPIPASEVPAAERCNRVGCQAQL